MPLIKTTVTAYSNFASIERDIQAQALRMVQEAAREGARVAAAVGSQRNMPIAIEAAERTIDGWVCSFVCKHVAAWFQNYGTLGNRRRKLKRQPSTDRTRAAGTGITPLYFLNVGKREGRKRMIRVRDEGAFR